MNGWMDSDSSIARDLTSESFCVVDPSPDKVDRLKRDMKVQAFTGLSELPEASFDIVLVAVKPQVISGVLEELAASSVFAGAREGRAANPLVVSIAAGVTTDAIGTYLARGLEAGGASASELAAIPIVRVMPNLPLQISQGASVVARGCDATDADAQFVCDLFAALGKAQVVDEAQIDAACAISGGGPAYVCYMIELLTKAGIDNGLSAELSEMLAFQTFFGTCELIRERDMDPADLRVAVCSPGGTTLAALHAMDEGGFARAIDDGVKAAITRAKELAG